MGKSAIRCPGCTALNPPHEAIGAGSKAIAACYAWPMIAPGESRQHFDIARDRAP